MSRRTSMWVISVLAVVLVLTIVVGVMTRDSKNLDFSKDEEPFKSIVLPPQSVTGGTYMDLGSAAMFLTDGTGKKYTITFPIEYEAVLNPHPTAYWCYLGDRKIVHLKDPARAKVIVVQLMARYGNLSEPGTKMGYNALAHPLFVGASNWYGRKF